MNFVRCSNCHTLWRPVVHPLTSEPSWNPPTRRRNGCRHDAGYEVWTGSAWDVRPLVQFARGGETNGSTQNPSAALPHSETTP